MGWFGSLGIKRDVEKMKKGFLASGLMAVCLLLLTGCINIRVHIKSDEEMVLSEKR